MWGFWQGTTAFQSADPDLVERSGVGRSVPPPDGDKYISMEKQRRRKIYQGRLESFGSVATTFIICICCIVACIREKFVATG